MNNLITFLVVMIMIFVFCFSFVRGLEKQDRVDCYKAQSQSIEFSEFFFMNEAWKNTCDSYGIEIDSKFVRPSNFRETL